MTDLEPEVHDYQPGHLFVRRDIRVVFACRKDDCAVVRNPLGDQVVASGVSRVTTGPGPSARRRAGFSWSNPHTAEGS